jgi:hypothetical protein
MLLEKGESLNHVFNEIVISEFFQVNLTQAGSSYKLVDYKPCELEFKGV